MALLLRETRIDELSELRAAPNGIGYRQAKAARFASQQFARGGRIEP